MNTPTTLHVAFRVGTAEYVINAADVLHLESYTSATHVPGAPSFVAGLVQVRGKLVPVVDLRTRFGLGAVERTLDNRVIVVKVGSRVAGLLVDNQAAGFIKAVATHSKRLLLVVDLPRLIGEEALHA